MGHKIHPKIHRMPVLFPWTSRWVGGTDYAKKLEQDIRIREFLQTKFKEASLDEVYIERGPKNITITLYAGKPGVIIGRGGQGLDQLRKDLERRFLQMGNKVRLQVQEVTAPSLSANAIATSVAKDIEGRLPFRRVMKQHIERVMKAGAQGVKISMGGRLNGAEIARSEKLSQGKIPLITLRSNVDFAYGKAQTMYGSIGIKVWIYKGESFERIDRLAQTAAVTEAKK